MDAERLTPTQRRLAAKFPPPSRYFRWVKDLTPCKVVIYARESSRWQDADGNLKCQIALLRRLLKKLGFTVIKVFAKPKGESGKGKNYPTLRRAVAYARANNAIIVAEAVNRLARPSEYHTKLFPKSILHIDEMEGIIEIAGGVTLATFVHPDTPESKVRGHQTRRGLIERARANRPAQYKKNYAPGAEEKVLAMRKAGYSYRAIELATKVPFNTARRIWIRSQNSENGTPGVQGR